MGFQKKSSNKNKATIKKIKSTALRDYSQGALVDFSHQLIKKQSSISTQNMIVEAFALIDEAIYQTFGYRAFDVQIEAGLALNEGKLIEMMTGEGKTLTAVFPAYLNALSKKGVHILTFNDYLARRDAEWMGTIYKNLGLSVGFIQDGMHTNERKDAYECDITYVTAKEAGFDYLRDCLSYDVDTTVHRPFHYAIVDEADSIMIDEARIPLVIVAKSDRQNDEYSHIYEIVNTLHFGNDYQTDEFSRNVFLTEVGTRKVEKHLQCSNLYDTKNIALLSKINFALHADVLLKRDVDYIVNNGNVELVDEFTGRVAEKRHWPDGLQIAVEAKEGIISKSEGRIMNSITMPNFLKLYPKVSGMTGTAMTSADEFSEVYGLETVSIPTNKPCIRVDYPDVVFASKEAKHKALVNEAVEINNSERPVLIGTSNIIESEIIADMLKEQNIKCNVLNANNDVHEAEIIANAGMLSAVTVSTNMAGRGTDIKLGGLNEKDKDKVSELGGLYVIGTNRHESVRIDNQLRGRAGRQGDPGSTKFYISMEDEIPVMFDVISKAKLNKHEFPKEQPISSSRVEREILRAQRTMENQNFDVRKTLRKYSDIVELHRQIILNKRIEVLNTTSTISLIRGVEVDLYERLVREMGTDAFIELERNITLYCIDQCWADYLEQTAYIRDGIHLVMYAGQNPLDQYLLRISEVFEGLSSDIQSLVIETFKGIEITENGVSFKKINYQEPSATWTYLLNDDPFDNDFGLMLASSQNIGFAAYSASFPFTMPIMAASLMYQRKRKNKHID